MYDAPARADASELESIYWIVWLAFFDIVLLAIGTLIAVFVCSATFGDEITLFLWHYAHVATIVSALFVCVARRFFVPVWFVALAVSLFIIDAIVLGRRLTLTESLADFCNVFLFIIDALFMLVDVLHLAAIAATLRYYDAFGYEWQTATLEEKVYF